MKKIFFAVAILFLLSLVLASPITALAATDNPEGAGGGGSGGIVTCGNSADGSDACTICNLFQMLVKIYSFIVIDIATPLAVIAITVGGIMMMISAGNPNLMSTGKKIFYTAIIGLVLVFCSYLIIKFILGAIGYAGTWDTISCS